jgi:hypothetical protein
MGKWIRILLYVYLAIGAGDVIRNATRRMAKNAAHAHLYEQLSYRGVTDNLLSAKPKK